jgi:hypothetical protein
MNPETGGRGSVLLHSKVIHCERGLQGPCERQSGTYLTNEKDFRVKSNIKMSNSLLPKCSAKDFFGPPGELVKVNCTFEYTKRGVLLWGSFHTW